MLPECLKLCHVRNFNYCTEFFLQRFDFRRTRRRCPDNLWRETARCNPLVDIQMDIHVRPAYLIQAWWSSYDALLSWTWTMLTFTFWFINALCLACACFYGCLTALELLRQMNILCQFRFKPESCAFEQFVFHGVLKVVPLGTVRLPPFGYFPDVFLMAWSCQQLCAKVPWLRMVAAIPGSERSPESVFTADSVRPFSWI